jgi:hypothetical protein
MAQQDPQSPPSPQGSPERQVSADKMIELLRAQRTDLMNQLDMARLIIADQDEQIASLLEKQS